MLGGGKFKNGAVTGAFSRLFNDVGQAARQEWTAERLAKIPGSRTEFISSGRTESRLLRDWETVRALGVNAELSIGPKVPYDDRGNGIDLDFFSASYVRREWLQYYEQVEIIYNSGAQAKTGRSYWKPADYINYERGIQGCSGLFGGCNVISITGTPSDANFFRGP